MTRALLPLIVITLATGCFEDRGDGHVRGALRVPDCDGGEPLERTCADDVALTSCEAFDIDVDFFTLEHFGDRANIRMQHGGRSFARADGLMLQITDIRKLRGNLGAPLPIASDANIRAALGLFDRCPDTTQSFALRGTVVFESFGVDKGDRVEGTIEGLEVRDARDDAVLGVLHARFDFTVRRGAPYETFPE